MSIQYEIPDRLTRERYIRKAPKELVDRYIKNMSKLSVRDKEYKTAYEEDLSYYNNLNGGFLTNKKRISPYEHKSYCHLIKEGYGHSCEARATRLLEINDILDKYIREGKMPLKKAQKIVKEFFDLCLCCGSLYKTNVPEKTIINMISKIVKKITKTIPLLEYAYKYILPIYFGEGDRIFDPTIYNMTTQYMEKPNNPEIRRQLKEQIMLKRYQDDRTTITTGIIIAIFMAVEKKFH